MPSVSIPKSFFVKERRMYSRWQFAFWREFFQNSVDAGAERIDVDLTQDPITRIITVTFTDDGCGMTRDVLENVYFSLGGTTKGHGDQVGGFGRARILTCFSMKSYTIHTRNSLVLGNGGDYEIKDAIEISGTKITVEIEDESYDSLLEELKTYLGYSQMSCMVFVNGIRHSEWNYRRKMTRHLQLPSGEEFASVYVNHSSDLRNTMTVRVNGALMFKTYISANVQVIVELHASKSRDVLTANRDGLQTTYSTVLWNFVQELAVETLSALKPKFALKNMTLRGRGMFVSRSKQSQPSESRSASLRRVADVFGADKNSFTQVSDEAHEGVIEAMNQSDTYVSDLPDVYIVDETTNEKVRRVIDNYNPSNWGFLSRNGKIVNKGSTMHKVLMLWKIACQAAVDALLEAYPHMSDISWSIGWVFSDDAHAQHKVVSDGHILLVNPVDGEGNLKFFVSSMASRKMLMAYAKHEVAHIVESYHNEMYANVLTQIDVNFDEKQVYRQMRELEV